MSDPSVIADVTAAADHIEALLPHPAPSRAWVPVLEALSSADKEKLAEMMRGGIGQPTDG